LAVLAWQIVRTSSITSSASADAAIVLGAAVINGEPSPVFEQRILHGIELYQTGRVQKLIFTGGIGADDTLAESEMGRAVAIASGVPAADILIETDSRVTQQNLLEACTLMQKDGLQNALIVSDPLHMKRSMAIAHGIGLEAQSSPTPTSAYKTWRSKLPSLAYETFFLLIHNLQFSPPSC
ncbi:MAG: YdcF family protein, partial [Chloroflexota bacterium]